MIYEKRLDALRIAMGERGLDALLLTPSTDLFYLTGVRGHLYERLSCCLVTMDGAHFVSPGFELGNLKEESRRLLSCHGWDDGQSPFALLEGLLPAGERRMAVGTAVPSWVLLGVQALRQGYQYCSAEELLREQRMVKDEREYDLLRSVQLRSGHALQRLIEHGLCGLTELQAAKLLMLYSDEEGIDSPDGAPIVAAGPNGALPHHQSDDTPICPGDAVVIDFGGADRESGYIADTTRTFAIKRAPEGFEAVYAVVREANEAAFRAAAPGVLCCDVDRAARDVIAKAGYGEYFTHRLGHGLGLDVHEHPYMSRDNRRAVAVGNVFSDEPGIYLPGRFGVRIEDQLFIRPNGAERLTELDHELHIVE